MFSSSILEGWLVLHLCYRKSGLYSGTAGLGWIVFSCIAGRLD